MILLLKISDFAGFLKVIFGEFFGHQNSSRFSGHRQASSRKISLRLCPRSRAFEGARLCHPSNRAFHAIENCAE